MRLAFLVAKALLDGDFSCDFSWIPSATAEPECIVLREGAFEREARMAGEERGHSTVTVLVVREEAPVAMDVAERAERWIRSYGWEPASEDGAWRVCGLDTTAPSLKERDGSGRFVWGFDVTLTVVRSL